MYRRSATGSRIDPTLDVWSRRRASLPSRESVMPETIKTASATTSLSGPRTSHRNKGINSSRTTLSTLGIVAMRSLATSLLGFNRMHLAYREPEAGTSTVRYLYVACRDKLDRLEIT